MTRIKRFSSCLAQKMERFIAIRKATGRDYGSQTRNLMMFDRFLVSVHWAAPWLSRSVIEQYRLSRSHVATSAQRVSMSVVRQFCRNLAAFDRRSHVPDGIWTGDSVFHRLPFVFTKESALFISWKGERLSHRTADNNFWRLMKACGISKQNRAGPTIHSLRHTFASHRLLEWYRAGVDINARLPILATYMGHVDPRYTFLYLHATPELLIEASQRFFSHYRNHINTGGSR